MNDEMNTYNEFAEVYDLFMEDVDYRLWCRYLKEIFELYGVKPGRILDTACGTGNITIQMSMEGFEMWGLDQSWDMLSIAENKARAKKQKIKFLNQNMINMNLKEKYDSVLCMCDGVNYILSKDNMEKYFKKVYKSLEPNGIFIFDVSSCYKLHYILGNNTFYEEKNNIHYIWNNNFDENLQIVEMDLTFFIPQKDLYRKFEEQHIQKAHKKEYLIELLKESGFEDIKAFDAFSFNEPYENSERIFFAAKKK